MPTTSEFLKDLEMAFRSFSPEDHSSVFRLINMGLVMHNMGWWSRMGWYLRGLKEVVRNYKDEMPEDMRRAFRQAITYYSMSKKLIGDMDSLAALQKMRGVERYGNPYMTYNSRRLFYEYLGHAPLAYKYLMRAVRVSGPEARVLWVGCRRAFFLMCGGRDPSDYGIDVENCDDEDLPEDPEIKEVREMTLLVRAHILSYAALMGYLAPEGVIDTVLDRVRMGMDRNYDHITLRILRAFIPVLLSVGRRAMARGMVKSAVYTARTERSRYMYEWFRLYEMALEGEGSGLKRRIERYMRRKYVSHEILARGIAARMGIEAEQNRRVAEEKAKRYGGLCFLRISEYLYGDRPRP